MATPKTKFNQSEAARIVGRVRNTIAAHLKSGKISSELDSQGNLVIDKSELIRVYGDDCDFSRIEPSVESDEKTPSTSIAQGTHAQLSMTEQLLEAQKEERKRERERLEAEIDRLEQLLHRSEERQNKITLLLEDRTRGIGKWETMLTNLQRQVSAQDKKLRRENEKMKSLAKGYKQALEEEKQKNKSFLQKLFG